MTRLLCLLLAVFSVFYVSAADPKNDGCKVISKSQAIAAAQKSISGKALSASLIKSRGPQVYKVKVVTEDGRVKTIMVDGCTARVIKVDD